MITDSTIEILALKCNSQDLFNAKIIASTNQMISGDKKHTTIMGKTRTTTQRKETYNGNNGCMVLLCAIIGLVILTIYGCL